MRVSPHSWDPYLGYVPGSQDISWRLENKEKNGFPYLSWGSLNYLWPVCLHYNSEDGLSSWTEGAAASEGWFQWNWGRNPMAPWKTWEFIIRGIGWLDCPCYLGGRMGCHCCCLRMFIVLMAGKVNIESVFLLCIALTDPGFARGSWAERRFTVKITSEFSPGRILSNSCQGPRQCAPQSCVFRKIC